MADFRRTIFLDAVAAFVAVTVTMSAGMAIWWLMDRRPVTVFHDVHIASPGFAEAGDTLGVRIDLTEVRDCFGMIQYWLDGESVISLGVPFLSRWKHGQREEFTARFEIPRWLPPGEYQVRRTAWYECTPLLSQHVEMPPVPVKIAAGG